MTELVELLRTHPLACSGGDKDDRGTVLIVGGPAECPGAVVLAAVAALRTGAGRVQLVVHPAVAAAVATTVPESYVMSWDPDHPLPRPVREQVGFADAVVVGPGYSEAMSTAAVEVGSLVGSTPLVLDAGALGATDALRSSTTLVLAPNAAEAERLIGSGHPDPAGSLAQAFDRPIAVRGAATVVAHPDGRRWGLDASPGLGTPGSGDVLVGALGALLAAGNPALAALGWAVALHGRAGELLAEDAHGGYLAREVADALPRARRLLALPA